FQMGKKEEIDEICERYLNRREERQRVAECVDRCLRKGYDYDQLKDRLGDCVSDSHKASKLLTAFSNFSSQFKKRSRFTEGRENERDRKDEKKEPSRRDKENKGDDDGVPGIDKEEVKRIAQEMLAKKQKQEQDRKSRVVTEDELREKELRYKAQQELLDAKLRLNIPAVPLSAAQKEQLAKLQPKDKSAALDPAEALSYMNMSMNKKSRMEELKAKLAKNSAIVARLPPASALAVAKVDAALAPPPAKKERKEEIEQDDAFVDDRLILKSASRGRRAMVFHEKGEFEQIANKQRAKAKLEKLQQEISKAAKQTGISSAVKLAMVTPAGTSKVEMIPPIEWWDQVVIDCDDYESLPPENDSTRYDNAISDLIEHPIKLQPPNESLQPHYLRVYLTTKERKKIRRQNRKETLKEKQEKIRLGLEKPPEPKMKLSNLMRVLGTDAIQDPTKMEAHVRKQMMERQKKHEKENDERKLTKEQKAAKKTKKLSEDVSLGVHVAVYRMKSLVHPAKKFKVEMNAKQLQMTGVILMHKDLNVVVVEGGPKQQKFYKNLLLQRVKWEEEIIGEKKAAVDKDQPGERNKCELIWEGIVKKRAFRDLRVHTATIEKQAREILEKHGVANYWDLAYSTSILLEGQNSLDV
ncbi:prp-3, partial [Pristionchus pacificus]